jgi:nitroreductase
MANYIIEAIKARRSIRSYSDQAVPKELIEQILDAGRSAPSSLNTQPWKFIVITDRKLIGEMSSSIKLFIKRLQTFLPILRLFIKELRDEKTAGAIRKTALSEEDTVFYGAPLLILIASEDEGRWVGVNCALAAQNMMLAAHSLGLGSCFIGRSDMLKKCGFPFEKLGIGRSYSVNASLIFGYPKEFPKNIPDRIRDNVISWK